MNADKGFMVGLLVFEISLFVLLGKSEATDRGGKNINCLREYFLRNKLS